MYDCLVASLLRRYSWRTFTWSVCPWELLYQPHTPYSTLRSWRASPSWVCHVSERPPFPSLPPSTHPYPPFLPFLPVLCRLYLLTSLSFFLLTSVCNCPSILLGLENLPGGQGTDAWKQAEREGPFSRLLLSENEQEFKEKLELLTYNPSPLMPHRRMRKILVELARPHYEHLVQSKYVQWPCIIKRISRTGSVNAPLYYWIPGHLFQSDVIAVVIMPIHLYRSNPDCLSICQQGSHSRYTVVTATRQPLQVHGSNCYRYCGYSVALLFVSAIKALLNAILVARHCRWPPRLLLIL